MSDDYDVIEEAVVEGEGEAGLDPDGDVYEDEDLGTEEEGEGAGEEERRPKKPRRVPSAGVKTATPVWVWVLVGGGALVIVAGALAFLHAREASGPVMANSPPAQSAQASTVAQRGTSAPASPITFGTAAAPPASSAGAPFPSASPSAPGIATGAPQPAMPVGAPIAGTGGGGVPSPSGGIGSPPAAVSSAGGNPAETVSAASGSPFPGQGTLAPSGNGAMASPVNASAAAGASPASPSGAMDTGAATLEATLRANLTLQQKTLKSILTQLKALRASLHHPATTHGAAPAGLVLRLREQRDTAWRRIRALSGDRDALRLEVARLKERLRLVGAGRRIFQGWRLIGVSNSAAILRNGQGTLQVVTPGHPFEGVKILAIDAVNLSVRTSAGRIPLPPVAGRP